MKKSKILMFAVVAIAITALNVQTVLNSVRSYDVNALMIEAISGEDDPIIDGGEIGGGEIVCSTGGSGDCYVERVEAESGGYCRFYCDSTGNPSDYCSSFWMGVLELCVNFMN